ncbi:MmcQ/YjbR family DNA-binding protein [Gordonia terrae]
MNGPDLHDHAKTHADTLPGAVLEHPFGPDWEVYKVRGKVFLLLTAITGPEIVILKVSPEDSKALQQTYTAITPGYHMNKKHWITVEPNDELPQGLLNDLITGSYLLVVDKLPRTHRPVNPQTYGRGSQE